MATGYQTSSAYSPTPPNSQGSQPFSPVMTSNGILSSLSPASPHSSLMFPNFPLTTHQLRPPKLPLYTPAVLRPTERPRRPSPLTPPRSVNNSTDSLTWNDPGMPSSHCAGTSVEALQRVASAEDENLCSVEGPPRRGHWKPDHKALMCDAPTCQKSFSLFERRHHCRHCGFVFCAAHSAYTIPLDHRAEFHPDGMVSRACKICWDHYGAWNLKRLVTMTDTASIADSVGSAKNIDGRTKDRDGQRWNMASSMPKDWNWSTF